jgi:hypothetical protein
VSRKSHKRDVERTKRYGFECRQSYITVDGKFFLFRADKTALRLACFERDRFTCQLTGERVDWESGEMDHVVPYSKGGDDTLGNVQTVKHGPHMRRHGRIPRFGI